MSLAEVSSEGPPLARADFNHAERDERRLVAFYAVQIVGVVFLQKVGLPYPLNSVGITLGLVFLGIPFIASTCHVDSVRLMLFSLTVGVAFLSQLLALRDFSLASFCLFIFAYLPFVLVVQVRPAGYRSAMNSFQLVMVAIAIVVVIQDAWQLLLDGRTFPDMNRIVPETLRVPGYNYVQPLSYGSNFIKPNAFFFLEVSFVSQYLACALVIELILFQRFLLIVIFVIALLASFAGTGLLLLAVVGPLLLLRLSPRLLFVGIIPGAAITGAAFSYGWYDQLARRFAEFSRVGSSAYWRFIEPGEKLHTFATHNEFLYTGWGAGAAPKYPLDVVWWAVTKLVAEYGFLTAIVFHIFLLVVFFRQAPSKIIGFTGFVLFSFMSSNLLSLPIINLCLLLAGLMRIGPPAEGQVATAKLARR